jgi:DHA2 family methylenomycin A resistance protein-like MFS transporter
MATYVSARVRAGGVSREVRCGLALAGLCMGTALIVMEANVVNVAVPTIRAQLNASPAACLWAVDAYTLELAALLLPAGRLGDRIGARRAALIGLAVFGIASIACSAAPNAVLLTAARTLQGAGAALLAPAPLTLITRMYADAAARVRAVATWGTASGVGFATGPVLGGLLASTLGWRSIFALNIPVVVVTAWLIARHAREVPRQPVSLDAWGQILAVTGLMAVVWSLIQSSLTGWGSPVIIAVLAGGLAMLACLAASQRYRARRGHEVLLPLPVLTSRPVLAGLLGGAVYNFTLYGMLFVYSLDFQDLRHYSPLHSGLAFLPLALVRPATPKLLGGRQFIARHGPRMSLAAGMSLSAAGLAVLAVAGPAAPYAVIAAGLIIFGAGAGMCLPSQTLAVMAFTPDEHKNMGSSALNTARQAGGVTGVALFGTLATSHPVAGTAIAMTIAMSACLLAAAAARCATLRGRHRLTCEAAWRAGGRPRWRQRCRAALRRR